MALEVQEKNNFETLMETLIELGAKLNNISGNFLYQICNDENLFAFKLDCNNALVETNEILVHYGIKATLNYEIVNQNINVEVGLIDLITNTVIANIEEFLAKY